MLQYGRYIRFHVGKSVESTEYKIYGLSLDFPRVFAFVVVGRRRLLPHLMRRLSKRDKVVFGTAPQIHPSSGELQVLVNLQYRQQPDVSSPPKCLRLLMLPR